MIITHAKTVHNYRKSRVKIENERYKKTSDDADVF